MEGLGRRAVELLLDREADAESVGRRFDVLPTALVVRRSCGAGNGDAPPAPARR